MSFARTHDPETSKAAARSVKVRTVLELKQAIMYTLDLNPVLSDEQILALVQRLHPNVSPSSLRTRRRELADEGIIRYLTDRRGKTRAGRSCLLWELAPKQRLF